MTPDRVAEIARSLAVHRRDRVPHYGWGGATEEMEHADDGEWIRYEHVEPILAALAALQAERDHERHEKETVADAAQAYAKWAHAEIAAQTLARDEARELGIAHTLHAQRRAEAAEAERETLRTALIRIIAHTGHLRPSDGASYEDLLVGLLKHIRELAESALAVREEPPHE